MQQSADFITADFLYMFRASSAHHQEYKILTLQPPVQVVMVAGGSSLRHMTSVFYLTLYYDARKHKIKINHVFLPEMSGIWYTSYFSVLKIKKKYG